MIMPLHMLRPGQSAQVVELTSIDPGRLHRLGAFGLVPGSWVRLEQSYPALIFRLGEMEVSVDHDVAGDILVDSSADG